MKPVCICFFIVLLLSSCRGSEYRKLSDFRIDETALKDGEEVTVLVSAVGPEQNQEQQYYNQLIVVSRKDGDTVNILVPYDPGIREESGDEVYNYMSPANEIHKFLPLSSEGAEEIAQKDGINISELENMFPSYQKVVRLRGYDHVLANRYPTVLGSIGKLGSASDSTIVPPLEMEQ